VWLVTIGLSLSALSLLALAFRPWRVAGSGDLGVMSQQWLSEHRAGCR
jgi:hypothetical protein